MKIELSEKDQEMFLKIVKLGDMDAMFEFGYICGKIDGIKEAREIVHGNQPK